jgi:ketosteroid isomerase-like protein
MVLAAALFAAALGSAELAAQTAAEVRAVDTAFAARAQVVPVAQAFREYMDEKDGVQFDGATPVRGQPALYALMGGDAPQRVKLEWRVTDAWGSKGGDMGVTMGRWTSSSLAGSRPPQTGAYVTVWRRDAEGRWKGLIDIGAADPPPAPATR